jgi:hypothetical protein
MAKKTTRRRVDAGEAIRYAGVAKQFFVASDLALEFEYWNAAGLLLVHGAIALADAVSIHLKSVKATSDDHKDVVALLGEVVAETKGRKEALTHLERIIDEKNRVAYCGVPFRAVDLERMGTHAERFRSFAEPLLKA